MMVSTKSRACIAMNSYTEYRIGLFHWRIEEQESTGKFV